MAETAGQVVSEVLRRARDPNGIGTTRDQALLLLTHVQRIVNTGRQVELETVQVSVDPRVMVHEVPNDGISILNTSPKIVGVKHLGHNLPLQIFDRFVGTVGPHWFRKLHTRYEAWARLGRSLFLTWPAMEGPTTLDVVQVKLTASLDNTETLVELTNDDLVPVKQLLEALLLLRSRDLDTLSTLLTRLAKGGAGNEAEA